MQWVKRVAVGIGIVVVLAYLMVLVGLYLL